MTEPGPTLADRLAARTQTAQLRDAGKGTVDVTSDGCTINNVVVTSPILNDWAPVFALFNLNADDFEVVDDTVRMSTWQQSKRTEDGSRDGVQLYAYSARFRRVTTTRIRPAVIDEWRQALRVRDRAKPAKLDRAGGTYVLAIADPQIGKKGTEEACENWRRAVARHCDEIRRLGPAVAAVHVAFMGDEYEGVVGNYTNQPHTVELNLSRQLETAFDLSVWTMREVLALKRPTSASSVVSNHGEWTRTGGVKEPVTTRNDNGSTHLARQVKRLFDELAPFTRQAIEWTIGETHPGITLDLSGVRAYFSHGYVEKGRGSSTEVRVRNAIERQILGRTDDLGDVGVWIMAHYHHFYAQEFEGRTLFGCPALEAERSSEYMLDQFGVWSPPGALGMLLGTHDRRGWSNLNVW